MNARTLALLLVCAPVAACDDDGGDSTRTAASAWRTSRTQASAAPAASVSGAPAARLSLPPPREFTEADFVETERSRDPFRSYARSFRPDETASTEGTQRVVLLKEFAVDDLKLIGIVTRVTPARAMLVDPTGRGHVVKRGQFIGRADLVRVAGQSGTTYELNWRLDSIRDGDVVLVREDPNNPDVPAATKVIPLRPEGTTIESGG